MRDATSALAGAGFKGLAEVREAGLRGMVTLRGDHGSDALRAAVRDVAGLDLPEANRIALDGERGVAWMSPDEVLVLVPYVEAASAAARLGSALSGTHHLVANVSDARAVFTLSGEDAREVLGKLTPADLHPDGFKPGQFRRSRIAQVPAAFWMRDAKTFELVCFRSVADYVFGVLKASANPKAGVDYY